MADLEETMQFDPEDGIADLDEPSRPAEAGGRGAGFKFDRHAARNELQAATFGKRRPAIARLLLSPTGAMAIEVRPSLGGERKAQQPVRHRHQRRGIAADLPMISRMMGIEPAGQRAECRHDQLGPDARSSGARRGVP